MEKIRPWNSWLLFFDKLQGHRVKLYSHIQCNRRANFLFGATLYQNTDDFKQKFVYNIEAPYQCIIFRRNKGMAYFPSRWTCFRAAN